MLKKADVAAVDNLIVVAYMNLTNAANALRSAMSVEQSIEDRMDSIELARSEIGCAGAHFLGAVDSIPAE